MPRERQPEYKPLSFSTTMRNPKRIADFIKCLLPFEGHILDNEIINSVAVSLIKNRLYRPLKAMSANKKWRDLFDGEEPIDEKTAMAIMEASPQNHKEAGFDKGWPSRFDTWYKLPMEFGFIYYEIGRQIEISGTGHMLIDSVSGDSQDDRKIKQVFLNALMKYQTNNPFRKNANENAPLPLLLNVIRLLKQEDKDSKGIYRKEIPLIICSRSNNADKIFRKIKEIRKKYSFSYGEEIIYEVCLQMLGAGPEQKKRFKIEQITGEAIDDFIRKMRITGIVSLRGNGRFLDFNTFEQGNIEYILKKYTFYQKFLSKKEYFEYMGRIDPVILSLEPVPDNNADYLKQKTLINWAEENSFEDIAREIHIACVRSGESKNAVLRFIDKPVRLEFLVSVILKAKFPGMHIRPNYTVDDEGLPVFTAAGGMADIECFDSDNNPLVEVTLMCSRTQATNEMPAITRHLSEAIRKYPDKYVFSVFIAPVIHPDTVYMAGYSKYQYKTDIFPFSADDFVKKIENATKLADAVSGKH